MKTVMEKLSVISNFFGLNVLRLVLFMSVCMIGGTSCSDKGDDIPTPEEPGTPVINEELMPFVGYWEPNNSDKYGDLFLFDDGTCRATHPVDANYVFLGEWAFDVKTGYFSNSATNNTFLLTLHNENTIMGVDISNQKTVTFTKKTFEGYQLKTLFYGKWKNEDGQMLSCDQYNGISGDKVPELPQNASTFKYEDVIIYFITQDPNACSYDYEIKWKGKKYQGSPDNKWYDVLFDTRYKGKLTIENPYSPAKCKFIFTGTLEGVYTRADNQ